MPDRLTAKSFPKTLLLFYYNLICRRCRTTMSRLSRNIKDFRLYGFNFRNLHIPVAHQPHVCPPRPSSHKHIFLINAKDARHVINRLSHHYNNKHSTQCRGHQPHPNNNNNREISTIHKI